MVKNTKTDTVKNTLDRGGDGFDKNRYEYMIAWRNKKIINLEERIKVYAELVNMCLAICMSSMGKCGKVSKKKVSQALRFRYEVKDLGDYYEVVRKEEENGEEN